MRGLIKKEDMNNRIEECVICYERVNEDRGDFKFNCDHNRYMHKCCIETLNCCPICRISSNNMIENIIVLSNRYGFETIIGIICGILYCIMVGLIMYPIVLVIDVEE